MMETIHCYFLSCGDFDLCSITLNRNIYDSPTSCYETRIRNFQRCIFTDSILFSDIPPLVLWRIFQKEGDKIENRALERRSARSILCESIDICIHIHRSLQKMDLLTLFRESLIFSRLAHLFIYRSRRNRVAFFWKEAG